MNKIRLSVPLPVVLGMLAMTTSLSVDILLPAFSEISHYFNINIKYTEYIITSFLIGFTIGQLIFGPIVDHVGSKTILFKGVFCYLIINVLSILSEYYGFLLLMRLCQGVAASAISVAINSYLREYFVKNELSKIISLITQIVTIGPLVGPSLGSILLLNYGWKSILSVNICFSISCLLLMTLYLPIPKSSKPKQDLKPKIIYHNFKIILSDKTIVAYILINSLSFAAMFGFISVSSNLYINEFKIPVIYFGFVYSLNIISLTVFSIINSKLVNKLSYHQMLQVGIMIQLLSVLYLLVTLYFSLSIVNIIFAIVLFNGCVPLINSNCMAGLLTKLPEIAGTASSASGTIRFGLSSIFCLIISLLPFSNTNIIALMFTVSVTLIFFIYSITFLTNDFLVNDDR